MFAVSVHLQTLISSLPPHPVPQGDVERLVKDALEQSKSSSSTENRRAQWEFLLRNEVLNLAQSEGSFTDEPDESYFDAICDRLDVILAFTEEDAVDASFIFTILQDLLETQTITSCSHIFSWMERRAKRLTNGMVPGRGKALGLLRALNDLLSRVSKMGDMTTLCGRILTFLSAAFPLGERSGVNLRGDYGPQWETVAFKRETKPAGPDMDVDEPQKAKDENEMAVDSEPGQQTESTEEKKSSVNTEADKRENFYNTFWSMQLPFSRPPLMATPGAFEKLKNAVTLVMPVIKEATVKERAMMGSKAVAGSLKRKRETTPIISEEESNRKYFFSKFLTSPELLELEIADTSFRRQFLFQLLILLSHLLQFTKAEKVKWCGPRNRSLQMDFTLEPDDAKWVQETIAKVYDEIKQTAPNGRAFSETVQTILEREKNWVRWKNGMCEPFEKPPLEPPIELSAKPQLAKLNEPMEEYEHKLGSEALTEIWAMGYRDLRDLENVFNPGQVKDFVRDIERANGQIKLRKVQLEKQARARAAAAAKSLPTPEPKPAATPSPAAPVPQRVVPPPPAASPPLHPSLPAKPGTQPVAPPPQPSPAPTPQQTLAPVVTPAPAPAVNLEAKDPMIMKTEESKQRMSWLALRLARDEYLHLFGKIGDGDVVALAQEIEKEAKEKERPNRAASSPSDGDAGAAGALEEAKSPALQEDSQTNTIPRSPQPEIEAEPTAREDSNNTSDAVNAPELASAESKMSVDS